MKPAIQWKLVSALIVLVGGATACEPDEPREGGLGSDSGETEAPNEAVELGTPTEPALGQSSQEVALEQGTHGAFGVMMPRGMIPIGLPAKDVFRFEGTHELAVVRRFIERQLEVEGEPEIGQKGEIVFRRALAIAEKGTEDEARLVVRIFYGSLGGASVDIRKETDIAGSAGATVPGGTGVSSGPGWDVKVPETPIEPVPRNRHERRQQVWEMMEKVNRGEKLSPQDLENPFFH